MDIFGQLMLLLTWGVPLVALVFGVWWALHVQRTLDQIAAHLKTLAEK